jgi:Protein of unknown function (DUF3037)
MARSYNFAVLKFVPDAIREESLNVAIIVLGADGLDVRVTPNPERLHAIAPRLMFDTLEELKKSLENLDVVGLPLAERLAQLRRLPGVVISEPGVLHAANTAELNNHIDS